MALDSNPSQRKGIFATDLADLRAKTIERFKLGKSAKTLSFYLEDFTEVEDDEYFDSIPGILRIFGYDCMLHCFQTCDNIFCDYSFGK